MKIKTTGKEIVERIDSLCANQCIKRKQLADAIGIGTSTIATWALRNTIPDADIALEIAHFFGVSVEWLITGTNPTVHPKPVTPPMTFDRFQECLNQLEDTYLQPKKTDFVNRTGNK